MQSGGPYVGRDVALCPKPPLSAIEGPWPDHESDLHPDEGGRSLRQSDDRPKPALADRLHVPEGHRLGLVLSVHRARCPALQPGLQAVHAHVADDVSDTLQVAPQGSGLNQVKVLLGHGC